jgi:ribonucleotide monophosphatase NagD (HAD superfamily)
VEYLQRTHAGELVVLVGEQGLRGQLTDAGFAVDVAGEEGDAGSSTPPDVVVSIDRGFDYGTLSAALQVVRCRSSVPTPTP